MSSFHERQKSLFNQLKDAEAQHSFSKTNKVNPEQDYGSIDRQTYRYIKNKVRQFRGRESIYKRQQGNIRECMRAKKVPDHMKNPQNYVYYSLSDVTPEQMSDRTNTATAHAHMRALEDKQSDQSQMEDDEDGVIFKKPSFRLSATLKANVEEDNKPLFKHNKIVMPEYVVGAKQKKEKKREIKPNNGEGNKKAELKLNHLYGGEDEEENE